jgi:hypothetical protein
MNQPSTEIKKTGIIVIQSLKKTERKTGTELEQDVLRYKSYVDENSFVQLYNAETKEAFISTLKDIEAGMNDGEIFTLHLETHGGEDGIYLASGECVPWEEFFNCIRPMNIKMGHLLVVVMSMCKGAAIIAYMDPEERAPYRAFIGAHRDMYDDELARGFAAFYGEYSNPLDIVKGMDALKAELSSTKEPDGPFWVLTCEQVFDMTFDADRDPVNFAKIVDNAYMGRKLKGIECTRQSVEAEIRELYDKTKTEKKPYFCFEDIYPKENK